MKPKRDSWTVVVQGAWNVRLFSPDWVAKNLFDAQPVNLEIPVGPIGGPYRYTCGDVQLIPVDDRLIFGVAHADTPSMQKAEAAAKRAVTLLSHTPIAGVGINLGYREATASTWVQRLFEGLSDLNGLSKARWSVKRSNLVRTIEKDGVLVNLTCALDGENGAAELHLNFHRDVPSSGMALEHLGGSAEKYIETAKALLVNAYGATLEDADDD